MSPLTVSLYHPLPLGVQSQAGCRSVYEAVIVPTLSSIRWPTPPNSRRTGQNREEAPESKSIWIGWTPEGISIASSCLLSAPHSNKHHFKPLPTPNIYTQGISSLAVPKKQYYLQRCVQQLLIKVWKHEFCNHHIKRQEEKRILKKGQGKWRAGKLRGKEKGKE